jgi:hypothetical protein
MEEFFVPFEETKALKELGFGPNTNCIAYYFHKGMRLVYSLCYGDEWGSHTLKAPLYSQAFKWFRDEYGLYTTFIPEFYKDGINFNWQILWYLPKEEWTERNIMNGTYLYGDNGEYPTQEEAILACLRKLIELVQTNKKKD